MFYVKFYQMQIIEFRTLIQPNNWWNNEKKPNMQSPNICICQMRTMRAELSLTEQSKSKPSDVLNTINNAFQVSWIRRKDYHLLTVGLTTYSSDERFSATHLKNSEVWNCQTLSVRDSLNKLPTIPLFQDWTLQMKYVQMRDAGQYECQVTKYPPTSIFLTLNVVGKHIGINLNLKTFFCSARFLLVCTIDFRFNLANVLWDDGRKVWRGLSSKTFTVTLHRKQHKFPFSMLP